MCWVLVLWMLDGFVFDVVLSDVVNFCFCLEGGERFMFSSSLD